MRREFQGGEDQQRVMTGAGRPMGAHPGMMTHDRRPGPRPSGGFRRGDENESNSFVPARFDNHRPGTAGGDFNRFPPRTDNRPYQGRGPIEGEREKRPGFPTGRPPFNPNGTGAPRRPGEGGFSSFNGAGPRGPQREGGVPFVPFRGGYRREGELPPRQNFRGGAGGPPRRGGWAAAGRE